MPLTGVQAFVGREADLSKLHQLLQQHDRVAITAIRGMGGIGKTELALQYAQQQLAQGTYPGGVCWLRAREEMGTQIVNLAEDWFQHRPPDDRSLDARAQNCWRNWTEGDVLVVVDDVQDYDAIQNLLPTQRRFKLLLTTRIRLGASVQELPIEVLTETAALDLLRSLVTDGRIERELATAKQLCSWLGYLPLGLELVGRYLARKPDDSLVKVQQRLQEKRLTAKAMKDVEPGMTAPLGIASAFELSWQNLPESAQELAMRLSLFAVAEIPWALMADSLPDWDSEELEDLRDEKLVGLHLVQRVGEATYQIHQLLREFFVAKLEQSPLANDLKQAFCQQMVQIAQQIEQDPTQAVILNLTPVMPHIAEAATTWLDWVSDEDLIWPFVGLGRFYDGQGLHTAAEPWSLQCMECCHQRLGAEHPAVATSYNNLAALYRAQGRYAEAEPLCLKDLELSKKLLGAEHPAVATSYNNLAGLYESQGRYTEAEALYRQALELLQKLLGPEHPNMASSYNNLAGLYRAQGRYAEAEPLYQQALVLRQKLLGPEHPDVATSYNNLAVLYESQGRYAEAEPLYQQALVLRQKLLGSEHPDVATSYNNLALLYKAQGRYAEAEPLYQQALALRQKLLGPEHPDVATSYNNLAGLYESQGRYAEAEPLYQQALALRQKLLGPEHPDVANSYNNLAGLYESQGRYTEAEPLYQQALALSQKLLGSEHPDVATSYNNLAELYRVQERYAEAEPLYLQALQIFYTRLGADHPLSKTVIGNLWNFLIQVLAAGREAELSDEPVTQRLLQVLREDNP